jgi:chorismate mutase
MKKFEAESRLEAHRRTVDNMDAALIYILSERFRCTDDIGRLKAEHDLPAVDKHREDRQMARLKALTQDANFDDDFIAGLMRYIIEEVIRRHRRAAAEHQSGADRAS